MKKSYSVGDISAANDADYDRGRDRSDESDDELDNRLLAEQYNREVAEMAAASSGSNPQPAPYQGKILFCPLLAVLSQEVHQII